MNHSYKYVWVGVRFSDIEKDDLFDCAIVIFGHDTKAFSYSANDTRTNHNIPNNDLDCFIVEKMTQLISENDNVRFMFYNQSNAYKMPEEIIAHSVCLNDKNVLKHIDDKAMARLWLGDSGNLLPYYTDDSKSLTYECMQTRFPHYSKYILQKTNSSGGEGTFLIASKSELEQLSLEGNYLVSPYLENSIAINGHIVVYNSSTLIFPMSIQLVIINEKRQLVYRGGDFIAYKHIEKSIRIEAERQIKGIAEKLRSDGYRGVAGVDLLVYNNQVYFMEINPRFQASSALINRTLRLKNMPSLQKINLNSFIADEPEFALDGFDVHYSSFAYLIGDMNTQHIFSRFQKSEQINNIDIDVDGYMSHFDKDTGAYAYRLVFPYSVSSAESWCGVRIHPNIYDDVDDFSLDSIKTKIELLNGGFYINDIAAKQLGNLREAVFLSRDIKAFGGICINCPITPFAPLSPYEIGITNNKTVLSRYGKYLSDVSIDIEHPVLQKEIRQGVSVGDIVFLSTDRIRIDHSSTCKYHISGTSCAFCSKIDKPPFTFNDIAKAVEICLREIDFRHFLVGGGSAANEQATIIRIIQYIRANTDKPISVMCLPPDNESIYTLYKNGVNEVAFNLELYSPEYAEKIMPGKGKFPREYYFDALKYAVSLWGKDGNVRSLLIIGLEPIENTMTAVRRICEIGAQPTLSVFRPLANTKLSHLAPPSNRDLLNVYETATEICKQYKQVLGPACPQCRNNTLS
jgi:hypothetical protein